MRENFLKFAFLILAIAGSFWVGSCSKAKVVGSGDGDTDLVVHWIDTSSAWQEDSLRSGGVLNLRFKAGEGENYRFAWDDSLDGTGFYDADIEVLALDSTGEDSLWLDFRDHGFDGRSVVSTNGELWFMVRLRETDGSSGRNGFKHFAYLFQVNAGSSSSSSRTSSARSSSSLRISSSSSALWSSSSSSSSSSTPSLSSSSEDWGNGGELPVSRKWTLARLKDSGSIVYVARTTPNAAYKLQWMDAYDYVQSEIQSGKYPSADIKVSAESNDESILHRVGDGATTAWKVHPTGNRLRITLEPNYTIEDTGLYYIRLYSAGAEHKTLKANGVWVEDSLQVVDDTIRYSVATVPGQWYHISWWDFFDTANLEDGQVAIGIVDSLDSLTGAIPFQDNGLHPLVFKAAGERIWVYAVCRYKGPFRILAKEDSTSSVSSLVPKAEATHRYIESGDTILFKAPVKKDARYRIIMNNSYDGDGSKTATFGFSYRNPNDLDWVTSHEGSPNNLPSITRSYSTPVYVYPTDDTLLIRVICPYYWGAVAHGVYYSYDLQYEERPPVVYISRGGDSTWYTASQPQMDTTVFSYAVTPGATYQIQWDDAGEGTGKYDANVKIWFKDKSATQWTGFLSDGYRTMVRTVPQGDSLLVRVAGQTQAVLGSYAIRVRPWKPRQVSPPLDQHWVTDSIDQQDTVWFCYETTPGQSYRVQWLDASDSTGLGNIKVEPFDAARQSKYSVSWLEQGYTLNLITAAESQVCLRVTGSYLSSYGRFHIRIIPTSSMKAVQVMEASKEWMSGLVDTYDTLTYKIPSEAGKQYRVQIASGSTNVVLSTGGAFTADAYSRDLVVFAQSDTITLYLANSLTYRRATYQLRVYELEPVDLPWSPSIILWDDSHSVALQEMVVYKVSGLTMSKYYRLRWDDVVDGSGAYRARLMVSVRDSVSGAVLMSAVMNGYSLTRIFPSSSTSAYIYVSATTNAGSFALALAPYN